jgi:predicted enzyme related to lactoylglutathione lyase
MKFPVVHFEIMGGSGDELERFYAGLFGWKINSNNPMRYGFVEAGDPQAITAGVGVSHDGGKRVTVYVRVDDLQATLDQAEKLGGKTLLPPSDVPGGPRIAMFADPAGNVTGLMQGDWRRAG